MSETSDPDKKPLPPKAPPGSSGSDEVEAGPAHQPGPASLLDPTNQPGPQALAERKPATPAARRVKGHEEEDATGPEPPDPPPTQPSPDPGPGPTPEPSEPSDPKPLGPGPVGVAPAPSSSPHVTPDLRGATERAPTNEADVATTTSRRSAWLFALRREPTVMWRVLLGVLFVGLLLAVWSILTGGDVAEERIIGPYTLPSPGEVAASLPGLVTERSLLQSIAATLTRVFLGFGLAVLIGVPLGILAAAWRPLNAFMAPMILMGRNIPVAALIPLTMMWFGIDETQKIIFIFAACVPFIFSDAASAVMGIHQRYVETAQTLGASNAQIVRKVLVPLAMPEIYTGLRYLFGLAFGYIMLAELVNANHGLGHLIMMSQRRSATADIFMVLLVITLLAFAIDRAFAFFQKGLFPYRHDT